MTRTVASASIDVAANVPALVDDLFRRQAGQIVATLTRILGPEYVSLAEEAVQEALLKALAGWPYRGVPSNPAGWLMTVARNHALDRLRRDRRISGAPALLEQQAVEDDLAAVEQLLDHELRDDQLRLMFVCCHPALTREAQIALTLKTLGGLGVPEIAAAFLCREATIAQRIVRAKRLIREQRIPFVVPAVAELPARLDAVLEVLYLLFNEGYSAHQGQALVRHDLCAEALRLTTLLAEHPAGDVPRVHALLALMLLHSARLPARTDTAGDLLLLDAQNRALWDMHLIRAGLEALRRASQGNAISTYHLQAGIAACHAISPEYAATDWPAILRQYDDLLQLSATPVVALNRAVALAMVHGPRAGLAEVERVRTFPGMADYAPLHTTTGVLLEREGEPLAAAGHFERALACRTSEPERRFLQRSIARLRADERVN